MVRFRCGLRAVLLMAMIMGLPWFQVAWAGLDEGLVAYYPFDGNADDKSVNGNHGTVHGATLTNNRFGNAESAYRFDGINDFIQISDSPSLRLNTFTVSAWIYQPSYDGTVRIVINKGGIGGDGQNEDINYSLYFSDKDAFRTLFEENDGTDHHASVSNPASELPIQTWHYAVGTYDGSNLNLYVNGDLKETTPTDTIPALNSVPLIIGKNARIDEHYFYGIIDDVRIYNRALSESEIQQLYNEKAQTNCDRPALYSVEKNNKKLIIPYINVPLLDKNYQTTGQFALFEGEFTQKKSLLPDFSLVSNRFKSVFLIPSNEACYADYSFVDRTLHIPFVEVYADVYEITLKHVQEVPLDLGIFRLESYNFLYTK